MLIPAGETEIKYLTCFLNILHSGALTPLHTRCAFFVRLVCTSIIFFELLIGYEYFHTEHKYQEAKSDLFIFHTEIDFPEIFYHKQRH